MGRRGAGGWTDKGESRSHWWRTACKRCCGIGLASLRLCARLRGCSAIAQPRGGEAAQAQGGACASKCTLKRCRAVSWLRRFALTRDVTLLSAVASGNQHHGRGGIPSPAVLIVNASCWTRAHKHAHDKHRKVKPAKWPVWPLADTLSHYADAEQFAPPPYVRSPCTISQPHARAASSATDTCLSSLPTAALCTGRPTTAAGAIPPATSPQEHCAAHGIAQQMI
jgi:hypothetical protein